LPQKTIESPIERKSPFPDESAGWPAFLWKQGTQKKSSNVSFPPIYAIYATKSEFIENGSTMQQAMGFSSIILRFHSTNRLTKFSIVSATNPPPNNTHIINSS